MTKQELIEKAKNFSLPQDEIDKRNREAQDFRTLFPIERLPRLTPIEYCGVGNRESFLYWVERRISGFGIGGGTSGKFGIYQNAEHKFIIGLQSKRREIQGEELNHELHELMGKLLQILQLAKTDQIAEITKVQISIWPMVLTKILTLYYPQKFLKLCQREVLNNCSRDLAIDPSSDLILLNWKIRSELNSIPELRDWDDEMFGAFVWRTYQPWPESPAKKLENPSEKRNAPFVEAAGLNKILFGPPGTGKTFNSIDLAVQLIDGDNNFEHAENKQRFDELRRAGQIEFVTFHQNYAYEDFMVGIRPDVDNEKLRFQAQKGIFYRIAKRARDNYEESRIGKGRRTFDDVLAELLEPLDRGQEIPIKMASGISFRITEASEKSLSFTKQSGGRDHTLSLSTLRDLAENVRDLPGGLAYYYKPLVKLLNEKRETTEPADERKNYVLIIDEINRANISRVFGELITLLEADKRLGAENELRVTLPNGEKDFGVPPNLFVLGTMNTADKSIALIDVALRRRFEFIGYYPRYDVLHGSPDVVPLLQTVNRNIFEKKKSADYLIGHAYFMGDAPIEQVLQTKVIPLLNEYFAGKTNLVEDVFEGTSWDVKYSSETFEWEISRT